MSVITATAYRVLRPEGYFEAFTPGTVLPLGVSDPGGPNVGCRLSAGELTAYAGDYTITGSETVTGLDITGSLYIDSSAAGWTVRDCVIRGPVSTVTAADSIGKGASYNLRGGLIEWCRLDGTGRESPFTNGVDGGNYTMRYSEVTRCVDGLGMVTVGNATVEACRIVKGAFFGWDDGGGVQPGTWPSQSDHVTHCDGVQVHQYDGWVVRGCNIGGARAADVGNYLDPTLPAELAIINGMDAAYDFGNAGLMIGSADPSSNPVGLLFEENWLEGGAAIINLDYTSPDTLGGVTIRNNRLRISASPANYAIYRKTGCTATLTNNTNWDTGDAVTVTDHA